MKTYPESLVSQVFFVFLCIQRRTRKFTPIIKVRKLDFFAEIRFWEISRQFSAVGYIEISKYFFFVFSQTFDKRRITCERIADLHFSCFPMKLNYLPKFHSKGAHRFLVYLHLSRNPVVADNETKITIRKLSKWELPLVPSGIIPIWNLTFQRFSSSSQMFTASECLFPYRLLPWYSVQ